MASLFAWMDQSEAERRRTLDIVALFRDHTTRDELGIGTVRDAFADLLFPGTSTIQTRAKYFLFVPWTYTDLERTEDSSDKIEWRARQQETFLIDALKNDDAEAVGVIGGDVGRALRRFCQISGLTPSVDRDPGVTNADHRFRAVQSLAVKARKSAFRPEI